ncbi:hypothetical protein [Cupriavidus oxalaticus]|uniref:DUF2917 domain-containing protein n=1 Tax=Cupriavidus oxalaticus TaxID=96344 RepID=A0A375GE22_9BURK|nr:hypothetical protein [Cupriavidus oxalaticus]QEZ45992.1 hypothetical protein D2917_16975 [Cupriavidus oxalaticus]QRQ86597.1 hypothetical protein JTE91_25710 [Cupriavidus oxalaticus]QRQ95075.1 hypothetical protein JTE92_16550 [Cupriavidus oxalaticus]WQD83731.1 hypothetical protein U0036_04240 [Cupriavidus oxalaticus]SPC17006.1 conserved hypothetical protein [Cupriavidus oxalaticus]
MPSVSIDTSGRVLPASATRLSAGQCLQLCVPAGTVLHAGAGRIEVSGPPQWLAESWHVPRWRLRAGETLAIPARGWLQVVARGDAAFTIAMPLGVIDRLAGLLAWRRRRVPSPWRHRPQPIADPAPEKL